MQRVFIDESGIHGDSPYLVIGSLWINDEALQKLETNLQPILDAHFINRRELKWKKLSKSKLAGYLSVLDVFSNTLGARFRCLVLDTKKIDHETFNGGDTETGYYKFVYQLACKGIKKDRELFGVKDKYVIYHDNVSATIRQNSSLTVLKRILNNTYTLVSDLESFNPVRDIQSLDSKTSLPLQLTDIMTGAVRHAFEAGGDYGASGYAKKATIEHLQTAMSITNLGSGTSYGREKFNTWEFKFLQKAKPPGAESLRTGRTTWYGFRRQWGFAYTQYTINRASGKFSPE
jgi:hypothetical protein